MKIQIEPRNNMITIKPSLERITHISYLHYRAIIPKSPEDVRLSDVKTTFPPREEVEYYFETKDSDGNIILPEVENDTQSIPLLDGMIQLWTAPGYTSVYFSILDGKRYRITNFYFGIDKPHGYIPLSTYKPKTLKDVKEAIPEFLQKLPMEGKSIKYFFEERLSGNGMITKEVYLDSEEVPVIEGCIDVIECLIMVSPDVCNKLGQRANYLWIKAILSYFISILVGVWFANYFQPDNGTITFGIFCYIAALVPIHEYIS